MADHLKIELGPSKKVVKVPKKIAFMSNVIKNMVSDVEEIDSISIPLDKVDPIIWEKITEFCKYNLENCVYKEVMDEDEEKDEDEDEEKKYNPERFNLKLNEWETNYFDIDLNMLIKLINTSSYLDIKPLYKLACKSVAIMVQDKEPKEVRKMFNIDKLIKEGKEEDFKEIEEEKIREVNAWCEEKK